MKIFVTVLVLLASIPVCAQPKISTSILYYDIHPSGLSYIGKEMHKRSPIKKKGTTFKGHTKWHVKWHFKWKKRKGVCRISQVSTSLNVKYTMPRIPISYSVKPEVLNSFNNYYKALMRHEEGHKNSGLYAARDIESSLLKLSTDNDNDCKRLSSSANRIGHKIINKYNQRDRDYDKKTIHGKSEGVDIKNFI